MLNDQQSSYIYMCIYSVDLMGNGAGIVMVNLTAKTGLWTSIIADYLSR